MRRCAELEGINHGAEFGVDVGAIIAEHAENFVEHFGVVVADAAGADFVTISHHVVLVSHDAKAAFGTITGRVEGFDAAARHAERVVAEVELVLFIIPFVKWEINDPGQCDDVRILQFEVVGKFDTQAAEDFVDDRSLVGAEEDDVAVSRASFFTDGLNFFRT